MVRSQAGRVSLVTLMLVALAVAGCSRERQDWRSAQSADTSESWGRFIEQHPDSERVGQARARIAQLNEQRDWQHALRVATIDAYRTFLARHPTGRLSEEARIRIEGFALGSLPRTARPTPEEVAAIEASARVHAFRLASSSVPAPVLPAAAQPGADSALARTAVVKPAGLAVAGDSAQPVPALPAAAQPSADSAQGQGVVAQPAGLAVPGEAAQPAQPASADAPPAVRSPASSASALHPTASATTGYGVQLGAFGSEASAGREWQRLQVRFGTELRGLSPRIVVATSDSGQLYRLQAPAAGEAQARAICASLREQSQPCVTVAPP